MSFLSSSAAEAGGAAGAENAAGAASLNKSINSAMGPAGMVKNWWDTAKEASANPDFSMGSNALPTPTMGPTVGAAEAINQAAQPSMMDNLKTGYQMMQAVPQSSQPQTAQSYAPAPQYSPAPYRPTAPVLSRYRRF